MVSRGISRRELLIGASAASMAGLAAGCSNGTSILSPGSLSSGSRFSPFRIASRTVDVSTPTGEAIQNAINSLASTGGDVNLTATQPYIVDQTITIPYNNINLLGLGPGVTVLKAKPGALLTGGSQPDEYLLLVEGATTIGVVNLAVNLINEANSSGHSRNGIGAFGAHGVSIRGVNVLKNLGPNTKNTAIVFSGSTNVKATDCNISTSRTGISVENCKSFEITSATVQNCSAEAPTYGGSTSAVAILSSTGGKLQEVHAQENKVGAGILVRNSAGVAVSYCKVNTTLGFPSHGNDGIVIEQSSGAMILLSRCSVLRNSGNGISAKNISNLSVRQCSIGQNALDGVNLKGGTQNVQLLNNTIAPGHATAAGITAGNSASPDSAGHFEDNAVHEFGVGVALGAGSSTFVVKNNDLSKNSKCYTDTGNHNTFSGDQC